MLCAALMWILKLLADYPDVQVKLREELQAIFTGAIQEENRLPTAAEIISTKLPCLDAVLEEVVRLRAATARRCQRYTTAGPPHSERHSRFSRLSGPRLQALPSVQILERRQSIETVPWQGKSGLGGF